MPKKRASAASPTAAGAASPSASSSTSSSTPKAYPGARAANAAAGSTPPVVLALSGLAVASLLYLVGRTFGLQLPLLAPLFRFLSFRIVSPIVAALITAVASAYITIRIANQMAAASAAGAAGSSSAYISLVSGWFGTRAVAKDSAEYAAFFDESKGGNADARKKDYMTMVNHYYNLVTDFYEYGWGYCFHFARRFKGEDFHASIARHEHWLAAQGPFGPGQTVIDLGCGVGGPMRAIARFSGANVIGINNNAYQIARGTRQVEAAGLSSQCTFKQCDFMNLDFKDNTVDGAYAIEATCHAPDKVACFKEIYRVLKPGASFVGYEWVMTDKYDSQNKTHNKIKIGIETGDSLPDLPPWTEIERALKGAGFEVKACQDLAPLEPTNSVPWYQTIDASGGGIKNFRSSRIGIWLTHQMCRFLELVRLAPKGTVQTHEWLSSAIQPLVDGGKTGIFTPMWYFKGVKPLSSK